MKEETIELVYLGTDVLLVVEGGFIKRIGMRVELTNEQHIALCKYLRDEGFADSPNKTIDKL